MGGAEQKTGQGMRHAACAALAAALATPAASHAAQPMDGRWAADPSACAEAALVVSTGTLRWAEEVCRIGRSYRAGNTLYLEAFCAGATHGRGIAVTLRLAGDRIFVTWNRVSRGALSRCR